MRNKGDKYTFKDEKGKDFQAEVVERGENYTVTIIKAV